MAQSSSQRRREQRGESDLSEEPKALNTRQRKSSLFGVYWAWSLMFVLAITAVVLGYVGLVKHFAAAGERRSFLDIVYFILCLFVVESGEVSGAVPWELALARVLAPLLPAWAILRAAAILFRSQLQALRLHLTTRHIVICGLGRKGLQLARDFHARGECVVVVEEDEDDEGLQTCRELGVTALVASATDQTALCKARVQHANHVFAVCGDDGTNVEIAVRVYDLVRGWKRRPAVPVHCHLQLADLELCELLRQHKVFSETGDPFEVRIFNTFENSARLLWQQHPLDRIPIHRDDPRPVHLIVIGFGQMGESVVLQAARTAHFANVTKPRITVVDELAGEKQKRFHARYPQLENVCDAAFLRGHAEDADAVAEVCRLAAQPDTIPTIAVCLDGDARCLSAALSLPAGLRGRGDVPLLVRMAEEAGLATLLDSSDGRATRFAGRLHAFGMTSESCSPQLLLNEELDLLARTIHRLQVKRCRDEGKAEDDPSAVPWERLGADLKDSNRHQADHIPVKLRAIACYSSTAPSSAPPVDAFSDEEVELMARMEHARWNAERWLQGWTLGPRDHEAKTSPYLVAWDELTEDIKEYDRAAVRNIPALLKLIGARIYRKLGGGAQHA